MPYFNQTQTFNTDKAILAFTEGNIANVSTTVPNTYIGFNSESRRTVVEGLFVAQIGSTVRFLPRAKTVTAASTGAATFRITPYNIFAAGDVLYLLEPHAILTVAASSATQTQTITVGGYTATATASGSTVATTATEVATAINATAGVKDLIRAIALGATVYIFPQDGYSNLTIAEGGTVTATLNQTTLLPNTTAIGTISSIASADGTVTLTGNAGIAVPIGASVGVLVDQILGLHVHSVDYTEATSKDLALYTQASGVRIQYLPYFDGDIRRRFPKMLFDYKF